VTIEHPFFFVPVTKLHKIEALQAMPNMQIIIDFEDAVAGRDVAPYIKVKPGGIDYERIWCRISLNRNSENPLPQYVQQILRWGIKKWVLPKLNGEAHYQEIKKCFTKQDEFIVLVETPRMYLEMSKMAENDNQQLVGFALGSHDLMLTLGASHVAKNLYLPRFHLKMVATAYGKLSIDIASMNLSNATGFFEELQEGGDMGYSAKFILHPKQLEWLNAFNKSEIQKQLAWADELIAANGGNFDNEVEAFRENGRIVEKPHLTQAMEIIRKYRS
jgi:citrate lyase subunit beta/citryl-CoA lyase